MEPIERKSTKDTGSGGMEGNRKHMELALSIAFRQMGWTSPNPPVGAVIVRNESVIATGGTGPCGSDHAEVAALACAGGDCRGADMYVSLEPCSHFGKTPPCTAAIIAAGISRVFIPALDPNPLVSGRGVAELEKAGVRVVLMEKAADYAVDLIRPFKKYILRHRPFVLSKSAVTLDGRIAARSGDSKWISSEHSRYLAHRLRAKVDAVIIGKNTFVRDNPSLNVRFGEFDPSVARYFSDSPPSMSGRDNFLLKSLLSAEIGEVSRPLRIVIGLPEDVDMTGNIMKDDNYLFFERKDAADRLMRKNGPLKKKTGSLNLHLVEAASREDEIRAVLEELSRRGVMFALLEGGGRLAGSFLDAGEIDEFFYIITPKIAGDGVPSLAGAGVDLIRDALVLRDVSVIPVRDDIIYNGYREPYHFEMM
ncbi:MAG: bifunctional diaminohydroxyphosphoribosylaminopyrimidine deaminase/5-amino-6-(5-phosphoribosylamino)uracil reductase RibD [Spirochaetes bacterium]|nr:bifunctional diaminohydroxyphosphoribosylaminopyrimidine deaminase/5-amino-6-(5-phosphoribosylamino)uracil reductase RibD [Spirochaetota bacterium]